LNYFNEQQKIFIFYNFLDDLLNNNDGLTLFDTEKYKNTAVSSFKLNEVFGYSSKMIINNMYEVFEPKADVRNIIAKGMKRKR